MKRWIASRSASVNGTASCVAGSNRAVVNAGAVPVPVARSPWHSEHRRA